MWTLNNERHHLRPVFLKSSDILLKYSNILEDVNKSKFLKHKVQWKHFSLSRMFQMVILKPNSCWRVSLRKPFTGTYLHVAKLDRANAETTKRSANDRLCRGVKKFAYMFRRKQKFMLNANKKLCFLSFKWNARAQRRWKKKHFELISTITSYYSLTRFSLLLISPLKFSRLKNCRQFIQNYRAAKHQILIFLSAAFINSFRSGVSAILFLTFFFSL